MVVSRHQPFCVVFRKNGKLSVVYLYFLNITLDLLGNFACFFIISCSTQLSMKFQLLIKTKMLKIKDFLAFKLWNVVFIMLINVKMPTIVGILTFMSMIKLTLS